MKNIISCVLLTAAFFLISADAYAEKIIAYPVPLNPSTQTLKLKYAAGAAPNEMVSVEIVDINGDSVFSRAYATLDDFRWKGFNNSGSKVAAGMYIIKIRIEDPSSGRQKQEIIRILVKR